MNWLKRIFLFTVTMILSLHFAYGLALGAQTQKGRQVIRVGYPIQKGFTEVDEHGNHIGYTYEYLQEIARYNGWRYEFVKIPGNPGESLVTLLEMLERDEIDLIGGMSYSDEMAMKFNYAGYSYGTVYTVLYVLIDNDKDYSSGEQMQIQIAVPDQKERIAELKQYCKVTGIEPTFLYCQSDEEMLQALADGRADAMLNISTNHIEGVRQIAKFAPRPYYFLTSKNKPQLVQQLNAAILNINQADSLFELSLQEKYFGMKSRSLLLSKEEKDYINQKKSLKVGILLDSPPIHFESGGEVDGIAVDVVDYITVKTGLVFEIVPLHSREEMESKIRSHEIDLIAALNYDYEYAQSEEVALTRPFLEAPYFMVLHQSFLEKDLTGKRLALPKSFQYQGRFLGRPTRYETPQECLEAVNCGKADYTYADGFVVQYYMGQGYFSNLRLVPQTSIVHKICFGVVEPLERPLLSILNKVFVSISPEEIQTIIYKNTINEKGLSLLGVLKANALESILIVTGLFLCVIGGLTFGLKMYTKMNRKIAMDLKKHFQVYELTSERFFEYDYQTETIMVSNGNTDPSQSTLTRYDIKECKNTETEEKRIERERFLGVVIAQRDGVEEIYTLCADGKYHWLRIYMKTIYDKGKKPVYTVGKVLRIDNEREEKIKLLEKAQRDSLTRLLNADTCRKAIIDDLDRLRKNEHSILFLIDIDKFKQINDTFGHLQGDQILCQVAQVLLSSFRADDIVGRPGGDEFLVYIKQIRDLHAIKQKCNIVCARLRGVQLPNQKHITVSIGIHIASAGESYRFIYQQADKALYEVKEKGRDGYLFSDSSCIQNEK